MPNPKFAAAVSVARNNKSGGSIPKAKSLVGGASSVGPEPKGDYDEVDTLHRALGSAIVDKIMQARKYAEGGEVGEVIANEEGDFLSNDLDDEEQQGDFDDELENEKMPKHEEEDDQTGEGAGGAQNRPSLLHHIMRSIRKRNGA